MCSLTSLCYDRTLGALAEKCHAFAKALHYREMEFISSPESAVEALISINNHLRLPEAADGILAYAQQTLHMELKVSPPTPPSPWCVSSNSPSTNTVSTDLQGYPEAAPLWLFKSHPV